MAAMKILIVEDDALFRETLKESLSTQEFIISEAPNGKVAREMIAFAKYDLIISDIQMPFFSGLDLLEWVKKNHPTKFILMTGFSQALEARKAHETMIFLLSLSMRRIFLKLLRSILVAINRPYQKLWISIKTFARFHLKTLSRRRKLSTVSTFV